VSSSLRGHTCGRAVVAVFLLFVAVAAPVRADGDRPDDLLEQARFDQHLNAQVTPELTFRDDTGATVHLGDYFGSKPIVLVPAYYNCPNLCGVVIHDLVARFKPLSFDVGNQFDVVFVSIDPRETPAIAAAKKQSYLQEYGRTGTAAGWHLLTGEQASIQQLADEIGFRYAYDAALDQYAHPSGLLVLTPQGKISRYFYGLEYGTTDLRLGLVEASANRIGSPLDQVLLRCYHYDPVTGKYDIAIMNIVRLAGVGITLVVGTMLLMLFRRERRGIEALKIEH
jgi:protein SCO1/2